MEGHVALGLGFSSIGLWHLFNHIKLHALSSKFYISSLWFPTPRFKYLELLFIMASCIVFVASELFIAPVHHQPLDPDGTIPSTHLHNFEHASMSMTFLIYALFATVLDWFGAKAQEELTQLLGAIAFAQQLLLIHLHSTDHTGPEGQYHLLLQLVVVVSLVTTLIGIGFPKSFLVSFVRSLSIFFQGVWLVVMGFMLWTPGLIPEGCFMNLEEDHYVVRCKGNEALHRANSLVNIQFSWFLIGVTIFGVSLYLIFTTIYGQKLEYDSLRKEQHDHADDDSSDDIESQKKSLQLQQY